MTTDEKFLNKISALLRLAETTTNEHEAQAFMNKAQQLATATAISLEVARQHQADKEKRTTPIQKRISIGTKGKKNLKHYVNLFLEVAAQNDVQCDTASNSTFVIAFGFPSDIDVTEMLYASLVVQMIEASNNYVRSGEYKNETRGYWCERTYQYKTKPIDGRIARASFQEAFIHKVGTRLRLARADAVITSVEQESSESSGTALVLANKAVEVTDFYETNSKACGYWHGNRSSSGHSNSAASAGREAGSKARLGTNVAIGGSAVAIGG